MSEGTSQGQAIPADQVGKFVFVFENGKLSATADGKPAASGSTYIQIKDGVVQFDVSGTSGTDFGILKLEGDMLTWCYSSTTRPTQFAGDAKTVTSLFVMKREK